MAARILVVEDDFLIRLTLIEALSDDGFEVIEASNAAEALHHAKAGEIAVLLTDIQLPGGMNGLQLADRIRQSRPELPVIYTTGQPDETAQDTARDLFVAKPYLPSQICAAAHRMIRG